MKLPRRIFSRKLKTEDEIAALIEGFCEWCVDWSGEYAYRLFHVKVPQDPHCQHSIAVAGYGVP